MRETIPYYDPNHWGLDAHVVEVVLRQWDYSATHVLEVKGGATGFSLLENAICLLYWCLEEEFEAGSLVQVILTDPEGNTLLCEDEEDREDEWLKDLVVSVRILEQIRSDKKG